MASVLLLGAGRGQVPAYRAARDLGLDIIAVDPDAQAPGLALAAHRYSFDLGDIGRLIALGRKHGVVGVFTMAADYPIPALAEVCAALALPGLTPTAAHQATHKHRMREVFAEHGVPVPEFHHAASAEQAIALARRLPGDAIMKPALSQGGRGVTRVARDADEAVLITAFAHALRQTRADGVMVEAFVEGPEFSVETLSWRGQHRVIAITEKLSSGAPHYVELGHGQPTVCSLDQLEQLSVTALAAVQALGISDSAGHSEIRLSASGPQLMETGARLGGGFICSHLVPLSTGVDLVEAALMVALDRLPDLQPRRAPRAAAIRFLTAAPGQVRAVTGVAEALAIAGVEQLDVYCRPGDRVSLLTDATARCGHVIVSADSHAAAAAGAEAALRCIRIETEADHG